MSIYWLVQTTAYLALVVLFIPTGYMKRLLSFAIIGEFLYTVIVQYTAVNLLNLWMYEPTFLTVLNVPVFFVISWFLVTKLYGYLLMRYPSYQLRILIIFILLTIINSYVSFINEQIHFTNWSITETFMFAVFSHVFLLYLLKFMYHIEELGAKENMLK